METQQKVFSLRIVLQLVIVLIVVPLLPILISQRWGWGEAWAYAALNIAGFVISRVLAAKRNPDIIKERANSMEMKDAKPWDKTLAPLLAYGNIVTVMVVGLDALFGWTSPFSPTVKWIAFLVMMAGYAFGSWALVENRFFSGVVRIQTDRGHHVVDSGPYRLVRHPGYAGALWTYLLIPVFLDSLWAFIPVALTLVVLFIRTALEDQTLQAELPGYKEFTGKTKYRLFPGIW